MTYYQILNVKNNATLKEIKVAYRAFAKKYHPDTYKGDKSVAEEKIKQINEAYDVLSNKELRRKYDEEISLEDDNFNRITHCEKMYNESTVPERKNYNAKIIIKFFQILLIIYVPIIMAVPVISKVVKLLKSFIDYMYNANIRW